METPTPDELEIRNFVGEWVSSIHSNLGKYMDRYDKTQSDEAAHSLAKASLLTLPFFIEAFRTLSILDVSHPHSPTDERGAGIQEGANQTYGDVLSVLMQVFDSMYKHVKDLAEGSDN